MVTGLRVALPERVRLYQQIYVFRMLLDNVLVFIDWSLLPYIPFGPELADLVEITFVRRRPASSDVVRQNVDFKGHARRRPLAAAGWSHRGRKIPRGYP